MSIVSTLRPDQLISLQRIVELDGRVPIFSDRRTGKTRLSLAAIEKLGCERVLIVGLNSFLDCWDDELVTLEEAGSPYHLPLEYLTDGTIRERAMTLKDIKKTGAPKMVAVNYEGWWRTHLRQAIRDWKPDMIIYDEAHKLITSGTHSARFAHQIARSEPWFQHSLALTATWQEGGFEDLFSLYKSVRPDVFSLDYQLFMSNFCEVATHACKACGQLVSQLRQLPKSEPVCKDGWHKGYFLPVKGSQIIGYKNTEYLFDKVRQTSIRTLQSDVNILPPKNRVVTVDLSPSTRKQYDSFMSKHVHDFSNDTENLEVFARIELSALVKAQELTGGWVQDQDSNVIDISSEKLDSLASDIQEDHSRGSQTAVYCKFVHDAERLARTLKIPENMTYSSLAGNGKRGREQRKEIKRQLLRGNLDTFIGIGRMAAYGLNLSMCDTASFFSTSYSSIEWEQLDGRLQAPKKEPLHRHYVAKNTIDENVYKALSRKQELRLSVFDEQASTFTRNEQEGWDGF